MVVATGRADVISPGYRVITEISILDAVDNQTAFMRCVHVEEVVQA